MAKVNEIIYGRENQWLPFFNLTNNQILSAYFYDNSNAINQTLYQAVLNNKIPVSSTNIDNTIAPWGINGKAMMCNIKALTIYNNDGMYKTGILPFAETENESCPIVLYNNRGAQLGMFSQLQDRYMWEKYNTTNQNPYNATAPVTSFNYNNIIMCCYLTVLNDDDLNNYSTLIDKGTIVELDKYFDENNDVNFNTHPYIMGGHGNLYLYKNTEPQYENKVPTYAAGSVQPSLAFSPYINYNDMSFTNSLNDKTPFNKIASFPYGYNVNSQNPQKSYNNVTVFGNALFQYTSNKIKDTPESTFSAFTAQTGICYYGMINEKAQFKILDITSSVIGRAYWKIDVDITKEDIYREFAYMGFWFTGTLNTAINSEIGVNCTDPKCNIPLFDDNGITTGEYKSGSEASLAPNAEWTDPHIDTPFDPNNSNSNNDDLINSNIIRYKGNNLPNLFLIHAPEYYSLIKFINKNVNYDEITSTTDWYGIDPADFIYNITVYPFKVPNNDTQLHITLGRVDTEVNGVILSHQVRLNLGTIKIPFFYNDFRDYYPYSRYTLYIPFIGTYELDSTVFTGHNLTVTCLIDLYTASVKCFIYRDNFVYDSISSNIGYILPLTAKEQGSYINSVSVARSNYYSSYVKMGVDTLVASGATAFSIGTGNVGGAVTAATIGIGTVSQDLKNVYTAEYMLKNTPQKPVTIMNAGGSDNLISDGIARVIISHHQNIEDNFQVYGKTVGFSCVLTGLLSDFHGYTVCSSVRFSDISMLPSELTMIKQFLLTGVILP